VAIIGEAEEGDAPPAVEIVAGQWIRNERRSNRFAIAYVGLGAVWTLLGAAMLLLFVARGAVPTLALGLVSLSVAVGAITFAWRCRQAGLVVEPKQVTIRNPWRTYVVANFDIHRFEAGAQDGHTASPNPVPGIGLVRHDGTRIFVWCLAQEGLARNAARDAERWAPIAEELTRLVRKAGA
jgi:hypothetical protein